MKENAKRTAHVGIRLRASERDLIEIAADACCTGLSEFIRESALGAAGGVVRKIGAGAAVKPATDDESS